MPRRLRVNWPLWFGVGVVAVVLGCYIMQPLWVEPSADDLAPIERPLDVVRERATAVLGGVWFFVFGATIGSFLNVVAYRMPMGLTIVAKPSRCPYCMTPILFRHNVPILGWLALRGRCFRCRLPISPRYPLVEVAVGFLFFSLFCATIVSGGANLPVRTPNSRTGVMWNLFTPQWDLIGIYFFYAYLLGVLATVSLIKLDRLAVPAKLFLFSATLGLVCTVLWPQLHPASPIEAWHSAGKSVYRLAEPLMGLAAGGISGLLLLLLVGYTHEGPRGPTSRYGSMAIYSLVGLFLGWQSLVPVLLIASLIQLCIVALAVMRKGRADHLWAVSATIATWLVMCFARQLPLVWLPNATSSMGTLAAGAVFGFAIAFVASSLSPIPESEDA